MLVITEAEKVLVKELTQFSNSKIELAQAMQLGYGIAARVANMSTTESESIKKLKESLNIYIEIIDRVIKVEYELPVGRICYNEVNADELTEKKFCMLLFAYQKEVEKALNKLSGMRPSIVLEYIGKELAEIIEKYINS